MYIIPIKCNFTDKICIYFTFIKVFSKNAKYMFNYSISCSLDNQIRLKYHLL